MEVYGLDLAWAVSRSNIEFVEQYVKAHPNENINGMKLGGESLLSSAVMNNRADIVRLLLRFPKVDVNATPVDEINTPFGLACRWGYDPIVRLLLADKRFDGKLLNSHLLIGAIKRNHIGVIRECIASGREIKPSDVRKLRNENYLPKIEMIQLLDRFLADPIKTRFEVRQEIGFVHTPYADLLVLIVMLCDGYFHTNRSSDDLKTRRFFAIARKLPLELQMIVCRRVYGFRGDGITNIDFELTLKKVCGERKKGLWRRIFG